MMKSKLLKIIFSLVIFSGSCYHTVAQIAVCDTMAINYDLPQIRFETSLLTSADSCIMIPFVNNTSTNFAYPLMKLINLTSLPPGMSYYTNAWNVFASSWNVGDTAWAEVDFVVTQAIPANYVVTFEIHMSNFAPLSIDSCIFFNSLALNLNPLVTNTDEITAATDFNIHPNPAIDYISITGKWKINQFEILSGDGRLIKTLELNQEKEICISGFENGLYLIKNKASQQTKKFVVLR
jgi:hypothetical protein